MPTIFWVMHGLEFTRILSPVISILLLNHYILQLQLSTYMMLWEDCIFLKRFHCWKAKRKLYNLEIYSHYKEGFTPLNSVTGKVNKVLNWQRSNPRAPMHGRSAMI